MLIEQRKKIVGVTFILPALVFFGIFGAFSLIYTVYVSFCKYDLVNPMRFVGLTNYLRLLKSDQFHNSLKVTLFYVGGATVPLWALSLVLALFLNSKIRFRGLYRTVYFVPTIMSLVVVSVIWKQLFHPYGVTNQLIEFITRQSLRRDWTLSSDLALPGLISVNLWKMLGYYAVLYLAGLQSIPPEYYEAARIDGSTPWKSFRYITLPLLMPTTTFVMIISIINAFSAFVTIFMMTGGGPADATRVLALFIYQSAFLYVKMGQAATISVFALLIILSITLIQLKSAWRGERIWQS